MKIDEYDLLENTNKILYFESMKKDTRFSVSRLVCDVGIYDADFPSSIKIDGKSRCNPAYMAWKDMLTRCYSESYHKNRPSYRDCFVCDGWKLFSNFYQWWKTNYVDGYSLDKDILFNGNKEYCPDRCIYVPVSVNSFVTASNGSRGNNKIGVYFDAKKRRYISSSNDGSGKQLYLGCFESEVEAHNAWLNHKFKMLNNIRPTLDNIDDRLYGAIMNKIKDM